MMPCTLGFNRSLRIEGPRRADHGGRRGRDHNDAGALRGDPALRLGVSDRAGTAPLGAGAGVAAHAVARVVAALGKGKNAKVLRDGLARWRIRAMNHGRLPRRLVIDLDSLPAEVHGRQPGSEWNGYYRARVYQPLVASVGERGVRRSQETRWRATVCRGGVF